MSEDNQSNDALEEELCDFCRSDSLSEDGLREIIFGARAPKNPNLTDYEFFHEACQNELVTEGILRLLLEYFPDAASFVGPHEDVPLHYMCWNKNATLGMVQLLIDACPGSLRRAVINGYTPLHYFCGNKEIDEDVALDILKLLLVRCPESVRHTTKKGNLPLHVAAMNQSPEFCRLLIESYPGSERITNCRGHLLLHAACEYTNLDTVKYVLQLYPEGNVADADGICPIHNAVWGLTDRSNPSDGIEVIQFLLDDNPDALSASGETPLHIAFGHQNELVDLDIVQLLIDAFPDFLRDTDDVGSMPLHNLCANESIDEVVALEILKLLIEKCPESVRHADEDGDLPIHIACCCSSKSPEFCRMLIEAYPGSERMANCEGALPFREACRRNTLATVKYLYKLYPEGNVADADGICPIHNAVWGLKDRSNPSDGIEVIQFLLDDNPDALSVFGQMPLGIACGHQNENLTLDIVQLLIEAFPDSLRHVDKYRYTPLHDLCANKKLDEDIALGILKLLLEKSPESVRQTTNKGNLPIHLAAKTQSLEFCRMLIEAYPGSERMPNGFGSLPFHRACRNNTVATVEYLHKLYPESISVTNDGGLYPIHYLIWGLDREGNLEAAAEMIQFLLDCNTDVALQKHQEQFPLYWVCNQATYDHTPKLNAYLKILQILYDAYPEAIKEDEITSNVGRFCQEVQIFINAQLAYARQATDHSLMHSPDESGQLPLHLALRGNATLGSIKLLVKGNPSAVQTLDNSGILPLHLACQHHHSPSVVEYLVDLSSLAVKMTDLCQNTLLHFACRGANHVMIAFLLEKYDAAFVATKNSHKQLPIALLFDSEAASDREGIEYMESIYRLIRANPETLMGCDIE